MSTSRLSWSDLIGWWHERRARKRHDKFAVGGPVRGPVSPREIADIVLAQLSPGEAFFYSEANARTAYELYRNRGKEVIIHYEDEAGNQQTLGNTRDPLEDGDE